jgi:DNA polymerase III subunit epsilon
MAGVLVPAPRPHRSSSRGPADRQTSLEGLTPLLDTTFVVLDLETTGLSPQRDRITEVGAVRARAGEVLAELRTFVDPGVPIPAAVTTITGITDADVASAPRIDEVLPTVLDFVGDSVLVAHNARFDLGFLTAAAERLGLPPLRPRVVDTATLARRLVRDEVRDLRLGTLARHFRAPAQPDHRALHDARATLHVLHALIERAGTLGATSIEDLLQLCGPTGDRSHRRIGMVADAPAAPGVYRFVAADGTVLYVGKANDLRRRLRSYFGQDTRRRTADLVAATERVEWTVTANDLEASVLEVRELQQRRPRYNQRSTRPDTGTTVVLTREAFPRLSVARGAPDAATPGLGPVPRSVAELVVEAFEDVFPLRPCRPRLRREQDHPACVLKDLHRCDAVCDGTQTPAGYAAVVTQVTEAFGDPSSILAELRERMLAAAASGAFERAASDRERIAAVVRAYDARRMLEQLRSTTLVIEHGATTSTSGTAVPSSIVTITAGQLQVPAQAAAAAPRSDASGTGATSPVPREEADLLRRWLQSDGLHLQHAEGVFASPLAGGRLLSELRTEIVAAQRASRGDEVVLSGEKVRRRTSSSADHGSGS